MKLYTEKMAKANKVLAVVKREIKAVKSDRHATLEAYANGREQGYCLNVYPGMTSKIGVLQISFSENRNSDNIVVYVGEYFDNGGNIPSEEAYKNKKYFDPDAYDKAGRYIVGEIKKYMRA